jgi:uncharacterized protein (TIGR03435 family)
MDGSSDQETRELPVYGLVVAKNGHQLAAPAHPGTQPDDEHQSRSQIVGTTANMNSLAQALSMLLGRPVNDQTLTSRRIRLPGGLGAGSHTGFSGPAGRPEGAASAGNLGRAPIFTALTEQLGLRVESRKGPVPVFVIETFEKPSEN